MSSYQTILTARDTPPDRPALLATLRATAAPEAGLIKISETEYRVKTDTPLTPSQITAAQNAIDTAPALTPQRVAQNEIDGMSIFQKAILLALLDEINRLRTQPTTTFANISTAAAIAGVRAKAGTL